MCTITTTTPGPEGQTVEVARDSPSRVDVPAREEVTMEIFWEECGLTLRAAIASTSATARLCVLTIVAAIVATWFLLVVHVGG